MAVIDLSNKGFSSLSEGCFEAKDCDLSENIEKLEVSESVQNLNASKNRLTVVSSELSKLKSLRDIDLSENCFKSIPQVLQNMTSLVSINLSNNSIMIHDHKSLNLEEEFEFLKPRLENKLELSNPEDSIYSEEDLQDSSSKVSNKSNSVDSGILISDHSFDFSPLSNLTSIDLSHNQIQFFPDSLSDLFTLMSLNISHNQITCLPTTLKSAPNLRYLDISCNRLVELPMWVGELIKCIKFNISGNPIGDAMEFPDHFGSTCRRLKYLEMENTHIRHFPSSLTSLLDLRHLLLSNKKTSLTDSTQSSSSGYFERKDSWDFFGKKNYHAVGEKEMKDKLLLRNAIWTFPASFCQLVGLVKLEAVDVGLADLPEALGSLKNLKIIDVSKNNLSWIPKSFVDLSSLEFCNFSQNSILMLPLDIETMPRLTHLLAANNMIAELAENLHLLKTLQTLDLYDNQISTVPHRMMEMGLRRLDLGQNDLTEKAFKSQTSPEHFQKYQQLQAVLRSWNGELEEYQNENYVLDMSVFKERKEFRTMEVEGRYYHQAHMNDMLNNSEENETDLHGNVDEDYVELQDEEDSEVSPEIPVDTEEAEDWTNNLEPYSPPKVSYCHNLLRMDQENWWGKGQFCPADQHSTPRNEKMLKNWERDRQMRMMRHVGRWGRREREPPSYPLLREGQFEDV